MPDAEILYRSFFEVEDIEPIKRAEGGDGRTVTGIAVPYGKDQEIYPGLIERFEMGSFAHQVRAIHRVPFMWEHNAMGGRAIGRVHSGEEIARGMRVHMRVSQLPSMLGDDALTLINDEVLRQLSIGFYSRRDRMDGPVTVRVKADMTEVALTMRGAYGGAAAVTGVRAEQLGGSGTSNRDVARQALARLPLPDMIG